jgi:hypothetical protein
VARGRGVDINLRTAGEPGGLTTGVDLLGYRVIEAALLEATGNRGLTDLTLDYGRSRLTIEICGQGPVDGLDQRLLGISERIALYDGTLTIRRANAEAFAISAQLPREVSGE